MISCPSQDQLKNLLAENLPEPERSSIESHIEECPHCQETLVHLTDTQELWKAPDAERTTVSKTSEIYLERIKQHVPVAGHHEEKPNSESEVIRFPGPPSPAAPLGELENYRILQILGEGGFGCVYKAYDTELQQAVALKILKPALAASDTQRARFEREARKAAAVRHDHVVTIHRLGKTDDFPLPFLVMEFVQGEPLSARLERVKLLPDRDAAAITRQVALGLAAAHETNVVHRDIKPSNILLCEHTQRAKITDFGIAREFDGARLKLTQTGQIAGTLEYMSPEHIRHPDKVDGRSDIYSLGIVLYEMLTGEKPFRGLTHLVIQKQLQDDPAEPRKLNDRIPLDLQTITLKCLAKDPDRRYQTARELADDLQRFLNSEPIQARPVSRMERTLKWVKRRPAAAALVMTSFLAALALVGTGVALGYSSILLHKQAELKRTNEDLNTARDDAESKKKMADAERQRVQHLLYIASMNSAQDIWKQGYAQRTRLLLEQYQSPKLRHLRHFEFYYLQELVRANLDTFGQKFPGPVTTVAVNPAGDLFAAASWQGNESTVHLWTAQQNKPQTLKANTGSIQRLAFSPGGDHLAAACANGSVLVWENVRQDAALEKKPIVLPGIGNATIMSVVFCTDALLAAGDDYGTVVLWDWKNKKVVHELDYRAPINNLAVSGDGTLLAAAVGQYTPFRDEKTRMLEKGKKGSKVSPSRKVPAAGKGERTPGTGLANPGGAVVLWDNVLTVPRMLKPLVGHTDLVYDVAISRDGKTLASAGFDHAIKLWNIADRDQPKLYATLTGHILEVLSVAFDHSGDYLASTGWDMTVKIWRTRDGKLLESFSGNQGVGTEVAFIGSGNRVVSSEVGGFVRYWDRTQTQGSLVLASYPTVRQPVHDAVFLANGEKLIATNAVDTFREWDLAKQKLWTLIPHPGHRGGILSPDGQWIALQLTDGSIEVLPRGPNHKAQFLSEPGTNAKPVFSPDAAHLATIWHPNLGPDDDPDPAKAMVKIWSTTARDNPPQQERSIPGAHTVAFHPRKNQVAVAARQLDGKRDEVQILLWNLDKNEWIQTLEARQGNQVRPLIGVNDLAFSPDGKLLASGNQDFTITVWNIETGQLVHTLQEHMCFVSAVAFSPDGKRLASGSEDWTVKLWDLDTGLSTITLEGHTGRVLNVSFSPDGERLASTSEDGTIRVWQAPRSGAGIAPMPPTRFATPKKG
jgi:WD40 repeat protein/serine/threonine protein kinase